LKHKHENIYCSHLTSKPLQVINIYLLRFKQFLFKGVLSLSTSNSRSSAKIQEHNLLLSCK